MIKNEELVIWEADELIYEEGTLAIEAYLIVKGYVNLETKDGLKLNRLGEGEIFGESSMFLDIPRTVSVKACDQQVIAKKIPKSYFQEIKKRDKILTAIIRKTQLRLIDSNKQSNDLANEMADLLLAVNKNVQPNNNDLVTRIKRIKGKISRIQGLTNS